MPTNTGHITQIIGPVVDMEFTDSLPKIYSALVLEKEEGQKLYFEVEQQLSPTVVRTIALGSTDGLQRGIEVLDTGSPISVPVGEETLGRLFNVVGEIIDNGKPIKVKQTSPIHKSAPLLSDQETQAEMLETGIKVIDLIGPFAKGGKVGAF